MRPFLLLAVSLSLVVASNQLAPPIEERINWKPCRGEDGKDPNIQCGRFKIPLDYTSDKNLDFKMQEPSLAVARYPATREPKLGTLFLGPGGPGQSGIDTLILSDDARKIMDIVGGQYDLVSWDPRGSDFEAPSDREIQNTRPRADCFDSASEENKFWENTVPRWGLETRGISPNGTDLDAIYDQVEPVDKLLGQLGERCLQKSNDNLRYMGTAATVRDLVSLHDYLVGDDKDINFWGFSYGTTIGIYLVNMFKERVGRIVLDGVVDPKFYANEPAHKTWAMSIGSSDQVLSGFLDMCSKAGPACAFASSGSTRWSLERKINDLIIRAYDYKVEMGEEATFGSAQIRNALFKGMYRPKAWPALAKHLQNCWISLNGLGTALPIEACHRKWINGFSAQTDLHDNKPPAYGFQAVTCADAVDAGDVTTRDVFDMMVDATKNASPLFGPRWGAAGFYCHKWPVRAVERYTGPWDSVLKNQIIVIGNEFDPITPLRSAESVAAALGDSAVLVTQKGYGHMSLAMHSDCTFNILHDYFLNGKLPLRKQLCETNQPIFEDQLESRPAPLTGLSLSLGKGAVEVLLKLCKAPLTPVFISCLLLVMFLLFWAAVRAGRNRYITAGMWKETLAKA
ncbi:hypothetical protein FRC12_007074 [Ceratobasidium sp. 428]|nr:hypothetical protein FRC12_007074 [Ceratobasidium sp. 428]